MNAAVGRAGSSRDYCPSFRGKPINPFAGSNGLPGCRIGPQRCPIAFFFVFLVWNGALDCQDEWVYFSFRCLMKSLEKIVPIFRGEKWIVKIDLGDPRDR